MTKILQKTVNLLMIEDSLGDARLTYEMLRDSNKINFRIEQAFRLSSGLDLIAKKDFDLILLDLGLPDSFGLDTLKRVVSAAKGIPIVVMTSNTDEDLGIESVHLGAQDYIVKLQYDSYSLIKALCYAIERKKTEELLVQQTKLINNINDAIVLVDLEMKIKSWNNGAEKILGWKEGEIIGRKLFEIFNSRKFEEQTLASINKLDNNEDYSFSLDHKTRIGSEITIECRYSHLLSFEGTLSGYVCIIRDITEKMVLRESLHKANLILDILFENSESPCACLDSELNFVRVNKTFARIYHKDNSYFAGKNYFQLFPNPGLKSTFRNVLDSGNPFFSPTVDSAGCSENAGNEMMISDWSLIPLKDNNLKVSGLFLSLSDINKFNKENILTD